MWAGIAGVVINNNTQFEIAVSVHDSVYSNDFASLTIPYNPNTPDKNAKTIEQHVLQIIRKFSVEHLCKFLGAGITLTLLREVSLKPKTAYQITSHPPPSLLMSAPDSGLTWISFPSYSTSSLLTQTL